MLAIAFYDVVLFVHVLAVVIAFGVTFTYPFLDGLARRNATELVALHRFQSFLTSRLITPAMVVVLLAGIYLTLDRWDFGEPWISGAFAILIVLFGLVGAVYAPTERRLLELAQRDAGTPSEEYERTARKMAVFGSLGSLLVVVAIFVMVAKPGL